MKTRTMIKQMNDEKGSLLIITLLVMVVLLLFGAAFLMTGINENRTAERQRRLAMAHSIAEAGINRALYDLRQDFVNDASSPSWADGDINGMVIGPDTSTYYSVPYSSTSMNEGSYAVTVMNVTGSGEAIWVQSTGSVGDVSKTLQVYARINQLSIWDNAIFAGEGSAGGTLINGNVDIRGSVHILGENLTPSDLAIDLGGTAELVGNNYNGLDSSLAAKVPALPTTTYNGEVVSTLNSELRVKQGVVGLSGSATVGEQDIAGNAVKETVDAVYVTDAFGGTKAETNVHSDNGWSNAYDLGDAVNFPSLSGPYSGNPAITYQDYLQSQALVINDQADLDVLAAVNPNTVFSKSDGSNSIAFDGNGNMTINGIVYIEGGDLFMDVDGNDKVITYSGIGSLVVTDNVQINVNLVTSGNNSFPSNIVGIMTPNNLGIGSTAQLDVMGLFYGENLITIAKQTNVMGTIVANEFNMGSNVPSIYQVPETINNLPPGMIGQDAGYVMSVVSWQAL